MTVATALKGSASIRDHKIVSRPSPGEEAYAVSGSGKAMPGTDSCISVGQSSVAIAGPAIENVGSLVSATAVKPCPLNHSSKDHPCDDRDCGAVREQERTREHAGAKEEF